MLSREATSQGPPVSDMPGWLILLPRAFLPSRPRPSQHSAKWEVGPTRASVS